MSSEAPRADAHITERLPDILLRSLKLLADTGEVEQACRLAGEAYVALRKIDDRSAQRFNALLHRLSRKVSW